jgi:hypothetical protein
MTNCNLERGWQPSEIWHHSLLEADRFFWGAHYLHQQQTKILVTLIMKAVRTSWNVCLLLRDYIVSYPRRLSSYSPPWEPHVSLEKASLLNNINFVKFVTNISDSVHRSNSQCPKDWAIPSSVIFIDFGYWYPDLPKPNLSRFELIMCTNIHMHGCLCMIMSLQSTNFGKTYYITFLVL